MEARPTTPQQLYNELWDNKENYNSYDRGEDIYLVERKGSRQLYIMNMRTHCAWEIRTRNESIVLWDRNDVDYMSLKDEEYNGNAYLMRAPYNLDIGRYIDGRTYVSWMLYPDGMYFADGEGYGMKDNDELTVYAVMDDECRLLHPFRLMPLEDAMRLAYGDRMPERKVNHRPQVTVPPEQANTVMPPAVPVVPVKEKSRWTKMKDWVVDILLS